MTKRIKIYTLIFLINVVSITSIINGNKVQKSKARIAMLKRQFASLEKEIHVLQKQTQDINKEIAEYDKKMAEVINKQKKYINIIKKRLQLIYEGNNENMVVSLLESDNVAELINSMEYLSLINKFDRKIIKRLVESIESIKNINNHLKDKKKKLEIAMINLEKKEENIGKLIKIENKRMGDLIKKYCVSGTGGSNASSILSRAYNSLGKIKYSYGATGPNYCDCSAFVSYCLTGSFGRKNGWTTASFYYRFPNAPNPMPGDICVTPGSGRSAHCGIYIGNGKMIHCSTKKGVTTSNVQKRMVYRRP